MNETIPEDKLYKMLEMVLFDKTKQPVNIYSGVCALFEQYGGIDSDFDSAHFRYLFKQGKNKKIDCITYLMKCVLKNDKLLEVFSTIYRQATDY